MILFTAMNLAGAKFMSESNSLVVIWKTAVPVLAIVVVGSLSFHPGNFTAGGGFAPFGIHGIFAALPAGVVFALQGFEQAVQLAGEAKNPKKDLSRAIITAMAIGATLYTLLQVAFIAGVDPADVADNWNSPLGGDPSDYGAWYTLALAVGAGWLATVLIIDCGHVPGRHRHRLRRHDCPPVLRARRGRGDARVPGQVDKRGTPVNSILVAASSASRASARSPAGTSWSASSPARRPSCMRLPPSRSLRCTGRTETASVPTRCRRRRSCCPFGLLLGQPDPLLGRLRLHVEAGRRAVVGLIIFAFGAARAGTDTMSMLRSAVWIGPWILGMVLIGLAGRYGVGSKSWLPEWIDLLVVFGFSLVIFYWAVQETMPRDKVQEAIAKDTHQIDYVGV